MKVLLNVNFLNGSWKRWVNAAGFAFWLFEFICWSVDCCSRSGWTHKILTCYLLVLIQTVNALYIPHCKNAWNFAFSCILYLPFQIHFSVCFWVQFKMMLDVNLYAVLLLFSWSTRYIYVCYRKGCNICHWNMYHRKISIFIKYWYIAFGPFDLDCNVDIFFLRFGIFTIFYWGMRLLLWVKVISYVLDC